MKLILHFTVFFFGFLLFVGRSSEAAEIINGKEVKPHSMPYMALIRPNTCGGILIDPKWVLTAAHCRNKTLHQSVVLGVHFKKTEGKEKWQKMEISGFYPHPSYNKTDNTNDIMLLKLDKPVKKTETVNFYKLKTVAEPRDGTICTVAGWGRTDPEIYKTSDVLMSANVTVMNRKKCNSYYIYYNSLITKDMICAVSKGRNQGNVYKGDSGGPLMCDKQLVGITSFGDGCGKIKTPAVYTLLSAKYITWIHETIKKNN